MSPASDHQQATLPATFFSEGVGEVGASVNFVIVPIMTVVLYAMIGGLLHVLLVGLGANAITVGQNLFYFLLPLIFVAVTVFAIKDFRRRAGGRVDVLSDGIALSSRYHSFGLGYDQIADVRVVPERLNASCQLVSVDGRNHQIMSEVASFQELAPSMEVILIPMLADQLRRDFEGGQTVRVSESRLRACLRLVFASCLVSLSIVLFFLVPFIPWIPGLKSSWTRIRQGWRGLTGGFVITREGISKAGLLGGFPREVNTITHVTRNDVGVVLHFQDGGVQKASLFATHGWVAAYWLGSQTGTWHAQDAVFEQKLQI